MKLESARRELILLNERFRSGRLWEECSYRQFEARGVDIGKSVVASVIPEGSSTHSVVLISQDGMVWNGDLDADHPSLSEWREVTDEFRARVARFKGAKPWDEAVIADAMFREWVG